jgi:transposase
VGRCRGHEADKREKNLQLVGRMKNQTNAKKLIEQLLGSKSEVVKLGLDVHARDVVVSIQVDDSRPQRGRRMSREQLLGVVRGLVGAGRRVYSLQEAGPCGYGLHRDLAAAGATSYVMTPQPLGDGRQQKTDTLDSGALTERLDRYLRGNTKAFSAVRVPTLAEESQRAQGRLREQLKESRQQWEARGRSLLLAQGHHVCGAWWQAKRWEALRAQLPAWLAADLQIMRTILITLDQEERARRAQLEAAAPCDLPKAVGALTWVLLGGEICDWHRFHNRRQVASYTGLCPGIHQSGGTCRYGSINRHGNPRVRHLLIELVWRLVRWQPDYPPVRALVAGVVRGAARRKLAVAAARRLAIDLWRLATGQTTPEKLKLIVPRELTVELSRA